MIPFSALTGKIFGALSLALLMLVAGMWWRIGHLESDRDALAVRLVEQRAEFVAASEKAQAAQVALRNQEQATFNRIAEGNKREEANRHAAILAAADAERLRRQKACVPSSRAGAERQGGPAPLDHGSSGSPELVAVPRDEWDKFVRNTERLELIHDFGNRLLDAGLAVKEPIPAPAFGAD